MYHFQEPWVISSNLFMCMLDCHIWASGPVFKRVTRNPKVIWEESCRLHVTVCLGNPFLSASYEYIVQWAAARSVWSRLSWLIKQFKIFFSWIPGNEHGTIPRNGIAVMHIKKRCTHCADRRMACMATMVVAAEAERLIWHRGTVAMWGLVSHAYVATPILS